MAVTSLTQSSFSELSVKRSRTASFGTGFFSLRFATNHRSKPSETANGNELTRTYKNRTTDERRLTQILDLGLIALSADLNKESAGTLFTPIRGCPLNLRLSASICGSCFPASCPFAVGLLSSRPFAVKIRAHLRLKTPRRFDIFALPSSALFRCLLLLTNNGRHW